MDRKRIGGAAIALAGGALASEFVVRLFDKLWELVHGSGPLTIADAKTLFGIGLICVGLFLVLRPSTQTDRIIESFNAKSDGLLRTLSLVARGATEPSSKAFGEIVSAYFTLDKLGIKTPSQSDASIPEAYEHANAFLSAIAPMIRDGHLREARREAPRVLEVIGVEAPRLQPFYRRIWHL